MPSEIELAFYLVGIRCRQACVLCQPDGIPIATALAGLVRLAASVDRLLKLAVVTDLIRKRITRLTDGCCRGVEQFSDTPNCCESIPDNSAQANIQTLIDLLQDVSARQPAESGDCQEWFTLGLEIANGVDYVDGPLRAGPSGYSPTGNPEDCIQYECLEPEWRFENSEAVDQLTANLGLDRDSLMPELESDGPFPRIFDDIILECLSGWRRIEAGLGNLEESVQPSGATDFTEIEPSQPPGRTDDADRIAPEDRTIPMSYRRAAKLMGKGDSRDAARWLSLSVKDKSIACEHITRQAHVFNRQDFPDTVWDRILPP